MKRKRYGPSLEMAERKRSEEELRALASFPSENPNPTLRLDARGAVVAANTASEGLLRELGSGIGKAGPHPWRDLVADALATGQSREIEIELSGRSYAFLVKPIVEAGYVNLYGNDITRRKRTEVELRESEEKYRAIVESSQNFIGIFQDGVLKYINQTGIEKLGWTYEELLSPEFDPIKNVIAERFRDLVKSNVKRRLRGEDIPPYEIALVTKNRSEFPVAVRADKITYQGRPAVQFSFSDITYRKDYETRLLALHTHASQLSSAEDVDTIARYTVDAMAFGLQFGQVYFLLIEGNSLQIKASRGGAVAFSTQPLDGRGLTIKAAKTKATLRISDTRNEPEYVDPKGYDWSGPPTVLSELVVPVIVDDKAVAVLCVDSVDPHSFTENDQRLLETLSTHVASALKRLDQERALRENEERFRKLFEEGPVGMAIVGQDFRFSRVNKAFCKMLGYSEEELIRLKFTDITHPEDINVGVELSQKMFRGEIPRFTIEKRYVKKNGQPLSARLTASIIPETKTAAAHSIAMIEDVTARKQTDEALRESVERYRSLFDRMQDGIYLSTHDGRFVDLNPAFVKMFGYSSKQEMLDIADIRKELYFSAEERGKHILDTGKEEIVVYRMRKRDGSEVWIEDHGRYIHDQKGNIIYHEGLLRDVTERKHAEEKLRESEERYRTLFDRMLDGIYLTTHDGKFIDLNPAFVKMFGYSSKQEMLDIADLRKELYFSPEERASHFLDTNSEKVELFRMRRKDGSEIFVEDHGRYIHDEHGSVVYHEGILRDVTERKRMEEELKQYTLNLERLVDERTRKLAEAERLAAIGQTAAMVGHDLRNPLQGIAGALHLLKQGTLTEQERDEVLRVIEKSLRYSDAIIRDLADFAAEIQLKFTETTPKAIITNPISAVKVPQNVTLQDLSEDQPTFKVDTDRIGRVCVNLIQNALDAMPQGGTLTIRSTTSNGKVEVTFTDTGSGISSEAMKNLWKPLQTTKAKGLGLGLAICKRIVDAHGGSMSVKSEVGKGTTFAMQLPISPVEVKTK